MGKDQSSVFTPPVPTLGRCQLSTHHTARPSPGNLRHPQSCSWFCGWVIRGHLLHTAHLQSPEHPEHTGFPGEGPAELTLQGKEPGRAFTLTGSVLLKVSHTGPTWRGPRSLRLSSAIHSGQDIARELVRPRHVWQGHCLKPVPGSDSPSGHLGGSTGSVPRVSLELCAPPGAPSLCHLAQNTGCCCSAHPSPLCVYESARSGEPGKPTCLDTWNV